MAVGRGSMARASKAAKNKELAVKTEAEEITGQTTQKEEDHAKAAKSTARTTKKVTGTRAGKSKTKTKEKAEIISIGDELPVYYL
jgi:hypothetical protein